MGKAICQSRKKVLLLNGCLDRETFGMTAVDFIKVIVQLAEYSTGGTTTSEWNKYITHLVYMKDCKIKVDVPLLTSKNITCVEVAKLDNTDYFDLADLENVLARII